MQKLLADPNVDLQEVIGVARARLLIKPKARDPIMTEFYLRVTRMDINQSRQADEKSTLSLSELEKVKRQYRLSRRLDRLMNINIAKQPDNIQRFLEILRTEMKKDYLPLQERIEKILNQTRYEKLDTDGNEISQKVCSQLFRYIKGIHENTKEEGKSQFKDLTSFTNWPRRTEVSQKTAKQDAGAGGKTPRM